MHRSQRRAAVQYPSLSLNHLLFFSHCTTPDSEKLRTFPPFIKEQYAKVSKQDFLWFLETELAAFTPFCFIFADLLIYLLTELLFNDEAAPTRSMVPDKNKKCGSTAPDRVFVHRDALYNRMGRMEFVLWLPVSLILAATLFAGHSRFSQIRLECGQGN